MPKYRFTVTGTFTTDRNPYFNADNTISSFSGPGETVLNLALGLDVSIDGGVVLPVSSEDEMRYLGIEFLDYEVIGAVRIDDDSDKE